MKICRAAIQRVRLRPFWIACSCTLFILLAACGGDDGSGSSSWSSSSSTALGGGGASTGGGGGSISASGGGGSSSEGEGGGGGQHTGPQGLADVGTLVVLGDSIGDGGGQGPYYYDLLRDALGAYYGKILGYHREADGGSKTSALVGQVNALPSDMVGPVAVTITSGGNDMKDVMPQVLLGVDGLARAQMGTNIAAALDALLQPGRFGPGVEVWVFYANIYDASGGQGNFQSGGCTIDINSPVSVEPFFANWNGEIATRVETAGQTLVDMHDHFYPHGYNTPPSWFASDCTHPNSTGHDQLRQLFYLHITGQEL